MFPSQIHSLRFDLGPDRLSKPIFITTYQVKMCIKEWIKKLVWPEKYLPNCLIQYRDQKLIVPRTLLLVWLFTSLLERGDVLAFFIHLFEAHKLFDNVKILTFNFKPGETQGRNCSEILYGLKVLGQIFFRLCLTDRSIPLSYIIINY